MSRRTFLHDAQLRIRAERLTSKNDSYPGKRADVSRIFLGSRGDDSGHNIVQQGLPSVDRGELLRNCSYMAQGRSDIGDQQHHGRPGSVHRRQIKRCLPGMFGRLAYGGQQQRPADDGLWLGRSAVPAPPVLDQRDGTGAGLASRSMSWVVKPPQPHWFFNSSKPFSASARWRQETRRKKPVEHSESRWLRGPIEYDADLPTSPP